MADKYIHQEYPRLLYRGEETRPVADADAEKKAIAEGFAPLPVQSPPETEAVAQPQEEIAAEAEEVYGESDEQEARDDARDDRAEDAAASEEAAHKPSGRKSKRLA